MINQILQVLKNVFQKVKLNFKAFQGKTILKYKLLSLSVQLMCFSLDDTFKLQLLKTNKSDINLILCSLLDFLIQFT